MHFVVRSCGRTAAVLILPDTTDTSIGYCVHIILAWNRSPYKFYCFPSYLPISLFIRNFKFFVNMFISHDILFHVLDYLCDAHALTFLKYFGSIKFARDIIILLRNDILTILRRKHLLETCAYPLVSNARKL